MACCLLCRHKSLSSRVKELVATKNASLRVAGTTCRSVAGMKVPNDSLRRSSMRCSDCVAKITPEWRASPLRSAVGRKICRMGTLARPFWQSDSRTGRSAHPTFAFVAFCSQSFSPLGWNRRERRARRGWLTPSRRRLLMARRAGRVGDSATRFSLPGGCHAVPGSDARWRRPQRGRTR